MSSLAPDTGSLIWTKGCETGQEDLIGATPWEALAGLAEGIYILFVVSAFFILGRVVIYLTMPDMFRGVLVASREARAGVLAHVQVVTLKSASAVAIAAVFACRQLMTLELLI